MRRPKSDGREYGLAAAANRGCMSKELGHKQLPDFRRYGADRHSERSEESGLGRHSTQILRRAQNDNSFGANANARCHWAVQA